MNDWPGTRVSEMFKFIFLQNKPSCGKISLYNLDLFSHMEQHPVDYLFLSSPDLAVFSVSRAKLHRT